jgi:hypothetical protein
MVSTCCYSFFFSKCQRAQTHQSFSPTKKGKEKMFCWSYFYCYTTCVITKWRFMSIFLYSNFLFLILWKMRESYSMAFFLCRQHQYDNPATFTLPSLSLSLERAFPVVKRFPFLVNSRPPIPTQTLLLQSRKRETADDDESNN